MTWTKQALSTPELLSLILTNADQKTQACSARVSRLWFDNAIPILWRSICRLKCLFNLFPDGGWTGNRKVNEDRDWIRTNLYARHVKELHVTKRDLEGELSPIIEEVAFGRRVPHLLPNLQELFLEPGVNIYISLLFTNESIKRLTLRLSSFSDIRLGVIFSYIIPKTPSLVYLCLDFSNTYHFSGTYNEDAMISTLNNLKTLESLIVKDFELSPSSLNAIALHPRLESFRYSMGGLASNRKGEKGGEVCVGEGPNFSQLKELILYSDLICREMLDPVTQLNILFPKLESLVIEILEFDSITTNLTSILENCCRMAYSKMENLSSLSLKLRIRSIQADRSDPTERVLSLECLRLLFGLRRMRNFSLNSGDAVTITDLDIEDLAQGWPNLVSFKLYSRNNPKFPPKTTFKILQSFATHCKNLEYLSIRVDGTKMGDLPQCVVPFRNLKQMEFGYSPINNLDGVVLYLCRFCTSSCRLLIPDGDDLMEGRSREDDYKAHWECIEKHFELVLRAIEQDRRTFQVVEARRDV